MDPAEVVNRYFAAMRRGPEAAEDIFSLFADDAVYVEPFSDVDTPAVGKRDVVARLRAGWEAPLPDLELDVLSVQVTGDEAVARWECRSPALPQPVHGEDRYVLRDGKIARLEVILLERPPA